MSESQQDEPSSKTSKLEKFDRILRIVKNLVLFWILLSVATGGFSCLEEGFKLEHCNPAEGVQFEDQVVIRDY